MPGKVSNLTVLELFLLTKNLCFTTKVDLEWGLLCFALNIKRMNKKDIEKLKEESMVKAILKSKNIINFLHQKIQLFRAGFSGCRFPILGHPLLGKQISFVEYKIHILFELVHC